MLTRLLLQRLYADQRAVEAAMTSARSPDQAIAYQPQGRFQRVYFERLKRLGVIQTLRPGWYWIDIGALERRHVKVNRDAYLVTGIVVTAFLILALWAFSVDPRTLQ